MVERPADFVVVDLVVVVVVVEKSYHAQSGNRVTLVHLQSVSTRYSAAVHARYFIPVVEIVAVRNHVFSDHNIVPDRIDSS